MIERKSGKSLPRGRRLEIEPLSLDEIEDAEFAARDEAWVAVAGLFDEKLDRKEISYQVLADRIRRKRSQVHRWLRSSSNVTLKSLGLLAAGMNAKVDICLVPLRADRSFSNECHPAVAAAVMVDVQLHAQSRIHTYNSTEPLEDDFLPKRNTTLVEVL